MTFKGTITKISDNDNAVRTPSMDGYFDNLPEIGERFNIIGESLTKGLTARLISTSPVQGMDISGRYIMFKTENSDYTLEYEII